MGVYLSSPITEKVSNDRKCKKFTYGASSMQGWRMSQEDAHNCVPEFEEDTSLFAVYDGHGGAEVAQYCALHLPDYIKQTQAYKEGDLNKGLQEAFLGFDETLTWPHIIKELKHIAGVDDDAEEKEAGVVPASRNETDMLLAEANMPLEDVLAKYDSESGVKSQLLSVKHAKQHFQSPVIRPKCSTPLDKAGGDMKAYPEAAGSFEESYSSRSSHSEEAKSARISLDSKLANGHADNDNNLNIEKEISQSAIGTPGVSIITADESGIEISSEGETSLWNGKVGEDVDSKLSPSREAAADPTPSSTTDQQNCEPPVTKEEDVCSSSSTLDGVTPSSTTSTTTPSSSTAAEEPGPASSSQEQPPGGSTSEEPVAGSSSGLASVLDMDDSEDEDDDSEDYEQGSSCEEASEDSEEEGDEELEEIDGMVSRDPVLLKHEEEPGSDSGCTAVLAILKGRQLVVANAGDSRCVLCREGKAVDLSFDHKPEDYPEQKRIELAGGKVTVDGRVNGGLNLSRAIGDHFYKKNSALPAKDQMITAFPDIQSTVLGQEDEFLVLACDGIWNYMSSQEVVDFVKKRLEDPLKRETPSLICEEIFDHCLAPNTMGDGTGCDNMTCIIVLLDEAFRAAGPAVAGQPEPQPSGIESESENQPGGLKRDSSQMESCPDSEQTEKRPKLECSDNQAADADSTEKNTDNEIGVANDSTSEVKNEEVNSKLTVDGELSDQTVSGSDELIPAVSGQKTDPTTKGYNS
ncbi:probable protein phosphatase CG10417 [Liolophura sinensis]|uniref:probable protein phosphatase CG10417 n=1 Tax=Liolophura sinensis TaxID=3198878 RepID=UPI003158FB8C